MEVRRAFRYRIYPNPEQEKRLLEWENALRFLWNSANEQRLHALRRPRHLRVYLTAFDQINELKAARAEAPWLADVPRNVCAQLLVELDKAWQRCFKRLGEQPRWKKKGRSVLGICEPHYKNFRIEADQLVFPKIGKMPIVVHRPVQGTPKTCTIKRDGDQWFASISCVLDIKDPGPSVKPAVAIDRGVAKILADSEGHSLENPRYLAAAQVRLARVQRRASKKKKGSKNRKKATTRVARLHRKVRRQRQHLLHVSSNRYANSHGEVVVEDLQIANMTASARGTAEKPGSNVKQKAGLNRAILDAGWGDFVDQLSYKMEATGGRVVEVPAHSSSQTCAVCGHVDSASRLSQSEFVCTSCEHRDDADINAARVLLSRRNDGGAVCRGYGFSRPKMQKLRVARRATRSVVCAGAHELSPKAPAFRPG